MSPLNLADEGGEKYFDEIGGVTSEYTSDQWTSGLDGKKN